ncbi:ATP-grasp fold amidoligase family protein [Flexibacterium corallicola]|uniref:ATP-grasp fold amidoligase family protein n=1 Tax=Flexibacterium corallicola TaxID=3037259 RepID=UPI00286F60C9|nr:ATP-grasp fold amidoligase family protein [Pseudovibrio sp. M1P-2-3]
MLKKIKKYQTATISKDELFRVVSQHFFDKFGHYPNLEFPESYNEKIQWLKIHDQRPEHVVFCDKLLSRQYVARRVGSDVLLDIYKVADDPRLIFEADLPERFFLKANHDSGSTFLVTPETDRKKLSKQLRKRLAKVYGTEKSEYGYQHIQPLVYAEELMNGPIVDYKFHCSNGKVKWVQVISDRQSGLPKEVNFNALGAPIELHLDHEMGRGNPDTVLPPNWNQLIEIAEKLSLEFKYARVDLYNIDNIPKFGELTFWPKAGYYRTKDNLTFGKMLDFDTSTKVESNLYSVDRCSIKATNSIRRKLSAHAANLFKR